MTCTLKKCWPDKLSQCDCEGSLKFLADISFSPEEYLRSISAWARCTTDNPVYMWQVLLSHVSAANFTQEEISVFNICEKHEVK